MDDPKRLVRAGYEKAARRYDEWSPTIDDGTRRAFLDRLDTLLAPGATVLELGCGTGLATIRLSPRYFVVGVDFSRACLELNRARTSADGAALVQGDMTQLGLRPESFDAAVGFYSVIHIPRDEQPGVLRSMHSWLRPGGLLLVNFGVNDEAASIDHDWRGVQMFWSSKTPEANLAMVEEAGFTVVEAEEVTQREDGLDVTFQWVVAQA